MFKTQTMSFKYAWHFTPLPPHACITKCLESRTNACPTL